MDEIYEKMEQFFMDNNNDTHTKIGFVVLRELGVGNKDYL